MSALFPRHLLDAFPVVMYGCESWTIKKAEGQRIDATELWWWRRLLRVPWTARRSNQSILKEISPGCSLEGLSWRWNSNSLATSWEELTHWKRLWCWEGLGAGEEGDDRGWDGWMASPTRWTWVWVDSGGWWWTGRPGVLQSTGSQRVGHDWATEVNWTELRLPSTHFPLLLPQHPDFALQDPPLLYEIQTGGTPIQVPTIPCWRQSTWCRPD